MTEKQYHQALANLSDRYLFENMSNREYEKQSCQMYSDQKVVRSDRNSKFIIIRKRECYECGHRWETIQYPEMIVSKQQAAYARCE